MTRPAATPARDWRDRTARAAAADIGRASDADAIAQARRLADRGRLGALAGLGLLALLGALAGWTTTAELLRPADGPVHGALALLALAGGPWLLLTLRSLGLLALRRRVSPLLGRIVTTGLLRAAGRDAAAADLPAATARRLGGMLAAGSGRRLAAAGSGTFWTAYAIVAVATIWIVTARVALGFGVVAGLVEVGFAQSSIFALSLVLLLCVGFTQAAFMILNMALVQISTPDEMLGRVFAVRMMVLGLVPLGTMIAGVGAEFTSAPTALAVMGLVASGLMLLALFWSRRLPSPAASAYESQGDEGDTASTGAAGPP